MEPHYLEVKLNMKSLQMATEASYKFLAKFIKRMWKSLKKSNTFTA